MNIFDRMLDDWNTESLSFELEGPKVYHGKPFPGPKILKKLLIKELNKLCELGVFGDSLHIRMSVAHAYNTKKINCTCYK